MARVPKTSRTETTVAQRAHVWTRYLEGHSYASISRVERVPYATVRDIIQKRLDSSDSAFKSKPRSGRPKKTSIRDERALVRHALEHPQDTLNALATPSKSTRQLSRNTVRTILKSNGINKRKPRKKPYLKPEHRAQRLSWARREKQGKRDWNKVCWSDEVTFEVGHDGRTIYVSRRAGKREEFLDKNLKPSFKSGRTSVGVWSCYCGNEMGPLVILEEGGRMTATRYLETVKNYFVPFYKRMRRKYGPGVVMQEDNAPWHTAKMVRAYLRLQGVSLLQWPAQSPDLSPIENLWKQIKIKISQRRHKVKNIGMMERALGEIWPEIEGESLLKLNESMGRRLAAVIKNKGGSTKY
jgi:transposase